MHLLIVRHGQSANNVIEALHGDGESFNQKRNVDPVLSKLGEKQAEALGEALAEQLKGCSDVSLACSGMSRAMQTIQPLSKKLNLQVSVLPDVHEVGGMYKHNKLGEKVEAFGMSREEIVTKFPNYDASKIPSGGLRAMETEDGAVARAKLVSARLVSEAEKVGAAERVVVMVMHVDFIILLAQCLLSAPSADIAVPPAQPSYWELNNTGVCHLFLGARPPPKACSAARVRMLYWNRTEHLNDHNLRAGVMWKNLGHVKGAAWAGVGEGGSGEKLTFTGKRKGIEYDLAASVVLFCCTVALVVSYGRK